MKGARKLLPPCECALSRKPKSVLQCTKFSFEERTSIFQEFWKKSWAEKRSAVQYLVDIDTTHDHRHRKQESSRRKVSLKFHLKKSQARLRVCKKMFMHTLGVNEWSAVNWAKKKTMTEGELGETSAVENGSRKLKSEKKRETVRMFLNALEKVPSHYCRFSTEKLYLEPLWTSVAQLFREYEKFCVEKGMKDPVKRNTFEDVMAEMKISLFTPKKDQCDTCIAYKEGNVSEEDYNVHQTKKSEAREAKAADKATGITNNTRNMKKIASVILTEASEFNNRFRSL